MEKRYQVFISSTFADLEEERGKVQQAVMELDCIPAGMELFPAIDEEQFEFIKKVIDDCDYYLLIIGGRYGSVSDAGVSYTEMEYRYAVSRGIKVIALLHKDPDSLPMSKSETDAKARKKLAAFRNEAATGRLVRFWTEANELPALTLSSLSKTMRTYPAVGWVRGDSVADPGLYKEIADLRKENQELRETLANNQSDALFALDSLAGFEEKITIRGKGTIIKETRKYTTQWQATVTWGALFGFVGAELLSLKHDSELEDIIARWLKNKSDKAADSILHNHIHEEDYQTIKIQWMALGLIQSVVVGDANLWALTEAGQREMVKLRVIRKAGEPE